MFGVRPVAFLFTTVLALGILSYAFGADYDLPVVLGFGLAVTAVSFAMAATRLTAVMITSFLAGVSATFFFRGFDPSPWADGPEVLTAEASSPVIMMITGGILAVAGILFVQD